MPLLAALRVFLLNTGLDKTYCIAYSGGIDSHVLLHALASLQAELSLSLRVIHINHGIHVDSKKWAQHCELMSHQLNIPYRSYEINIQKNNGDSLEEAARDARYAIFSEMMNSNDVLLTAHHESDQAETYLLQLCRGAGIPGLSCMPVMKSFSKGHHARPLLFVPKKQILQYAQQHALNFIEDSSNFNTNFSRNFMRHEVLPLLDQHYPNVASAIARSAAHTQEANYLLDELAAEILENIKGSKLNTLSIKKLSELSLVKQKCVLRYWIKKLNIKLPNSKKFEELIYQMHHAANDRSMKIEWDNACVRKYRDDLYLLTNSKIIYEIPEEFKNNEIKYRQGGEIIFYKNHHRELNKCFQAWGIPPWERDTIPLIYVGGTIVCIPGFYLLQ